MSEYVLENIKFRKAIIEDCPKLSFLKKEIYENTFRGIYPDDLINNYDFDANVSKFEMFVKSEEMNLYVVTDSDEIIGYFEYGKPYRPFGNYTQEIGLFYLSKDYRKLGIGRQMFNFAYEQIKNTGVNNFFISCNKFNIDAQKFYERMGGTIVHIDEDAANEGVPQVKFEYIIKS